MSLESADWKERHGYEDPNWRLVTLTCCLCRKYGVPLDDQRRCETCQPVAKPASVVGPYIAVPLGDAPQVTRRRRRHG